MERVDCLDDQAPAAPLHFVVKVAALGWKWAGEKGMASHIRSVVGLGLFIDTGHTTAFWHGGLKFLMKLHPPPYSPPHECLFPPHVTCRIKFFERWKKKGPRAQVEKEEEWASVGKNSGSTSRCHQCQNDLKCSNTLFLLSVIQVSETETLGKKSLVLKVCTFGSWKVKWQCCHKWCWEGID